MQFIPLLLLMAGCQGSGANDTTSPAKADTIATTIARVPPQEMKYYLGRVKSGFDSMFRRNRLNGSLLVAKHGEIIYEQYSGYSNPRRPVDSINSQTPFHLASVSKTFTGMAVLKLWEQGKLNIDDSVSRYLPGFPCQGVTVRMLLNHRSGIPKYDHYMEQLGWNRKQPVSNQDVLNFLIARRKDIAIGRPDRGFSYSNTNYALLALIIEKVSGTSYANYLKQTFFDPLGMKDSYVCTVQDTARCLDSYYYSGKPYAFDFLDLVYGDKNVYSTVRDLLKWDQALHNNTLFSAKTLEAAYTPYSNEKPGTHNYGLGWRMYVLKNGKKIIYHNGWWHGNRTAFYRLIDEDVTIIALCNNDSKKVYSVKEIADVFGDYMQRRDTGDDDDNQPVVKHKRTTTRSHTVYKKKTARSSFAAKK